VSSLCWRPFHCRLKTCHLADYRERSPRDSLACDLMEPIRPQVDAYLLDWLIRGPLKRDWFFEQRDGNCRLMDPFTAKLSESAPIWRSALATFAEGIALAIWSATSKKKRNENLSTPLTQTQKRHATGFSVEVKPISVSNSPNVCRICGMKIEAAHRYCRSCAPTIRRENVLKAAVLGRAKTHNPVAQAKRAKTQRRQQAARKAWTPDEKPDWLDATAYKEKIQPRLTTVTVAAIMSSLDVSEPYALRIRSAKCRPHPRHWAPLAKLVL
jgi:hypothetical protein